MLLLGRPAIGRGALLNHSSALSKTQGSSSAAQLEVRREAKAGTNNPDGLACLDDIPEINSNFLGRLRNDDSAPRGQCERWVSRNAWNYSI